MTADDGRHAYLWSDGLFRTSPEYANQQPYSASTVDSLDVTGADLDSDALATALARTEELGRAGPEWVAPEVVVRAAIRAYCGALETKARPDLVVRLVPAPEQDRREIREDAVQVLERALAQARDGRILGVALATVNVDRTTMTDYSKYGEHQTLLGALVVLQHRLVVEDNPLWARQE
jgi:hypothetical protein